MMQIAEGRAHIFGDDIDTDALAPGRYMAAPLEELASHCLESVDPDFASSVGAGDTVIAGRNFGIGSSREQAAMVLRQLGVAGVVARSFGGIFYRNAINVGLPVLVSARMPAIAPGDRVILDVGGARLTQGSTVYDLDPLPETLRRILIDGGLIGHLKKRYGATTGHEA